MIMMEWFKKHINPILSLVLFLAVIYFAIAKWSELVDSFKQVRLNWFALGLVCYGINYLLRALRIKMIIGDRARFWPGAMHAACLHGFATYLLPFRSGELTLPVLLRRNFGITMTEGAKVLIKARLLDLVALGIWIVFASIVIDVSIPPLIHRLWVFSGMGLIVLPMVVQIVIKRGRHLQGIIWKKMIQWGGVSTFCLQEVIISIGIWTCVAACFFCTVQAIGLPLSFMQIWLLITIQLPLQLIPLQGVANAGNHEGGWVAGLTLLGSTAAQGLHFALLSHSLVMMYVLILGPAAVFIKILQNRNTVNHSVDSRAS